MNETRVPSAMRERYEEIVALTDSVCEQHLDGGYRALARTMTCELALLHPCPLVRGSALNWAGGVLYALGQVNSLFYKSPLGAPTLPAAALCNALAVSPQTAAGRAKAVLDLLGVEFHDERYRHPMLLARDEELMFEISETVSAVNAGRASRQTGGEQSSEWPFEVMRSDDGDELLCLSALRHMLDCAERGELTEAQLATVAADSDAGELTAFSGTQEPSGAQVRLQGHLTAVLKEKLSQARPIALSYEDIEDAGADLSPKAMRAALDFKLTEPAVLVDCAAEDVATLTCEDPKGEDLGGFYAGALIWQDGDGFSLMAFGGQPQWWEDQVNLAHLCVARPYLTFTQEERQAHPGEMLCTRFQTPFSFTVHAPGDEDDEICNARYENALAVSLAALVAFTGALKAGL